MKSTDPKSSARVSNRRAFLRKAGSVAAVSALAGVRVPRVHAAEDNTIRLALIGCGGRGSGAVGDALSATGGPVKLVAMADLFEGRLNASYDGLSKQFGEKIDVPPQHRFVGFDAYRKAIDCLGAGDVALLTTHAAFRPMMFEYAVEKGVNVFAEKSFATDGPNTARWMKAAEASEKKNLKVGVGFMWRHSQARQEVIRRIHDGEIGDLHTLRIYRVHGPVFCPKLPEGANELLFQLQHATCFSWTSSGFFVDWHCHNVDVACWTKNAWPVEARAMGGRCDEQAGSQFDHFSVEYTFADGAKLFAFARHMHNCWNTYSDYAHGSKGSAVLMTSLARPGTRIFRSQRMEDDDLAWKFEGEEPNPYQVEWQVLLDAIRQDKPHNEARRAGEANLVGLMGRAAAHTGQVITFDQMKASAYQYVADIDGMTAETEAPLHADAGGFYQPPMPGVTVEV